MKKASSCLFVMVVGVQLVAGCTGEGDTASSGVTEAELALSTVPTGVQCVRIAVTVGSSTVTPPLITVAAGASSASLTIGQLPTGAATFNGAAFNVACASVTGSTVGSWIAVPATTTLSLGITNKVTMTFLPNNAVGVNANFLPAPVELGLGANVTRVRMGDGTIREWGKMVSGSVATQPTTVSGINDAVQIASGQYDMACARRPMGALSCWGSGALWGGTPGTTTTPQAVTFFNGDPLSWISLGSGFGCGMARNFVDCWGSNGTGAFGNGSTGFVGAPVSTGNEVGKVFTGTNHSCFAGSAGEVYCTGDNTFGQLGLGNTTSRVFGGQVDGITGTVDVTTSVRHSCAVRGDGTVRCWGYNQYGQLGDGTTIQRLSPVQVAGITDATHVVAGMDHTCVLRQMGTVSCWGKGSALGDGIGLDRATPADVPGLSGVIALDSHLGEHTCVILADRTVKCWGQNYGAEVDGTFVFAARPTTVTLQ